jgi:hypothetical protein
MIINASYWHWCFHADYFRLNITPCRHWYLIIDAITLLAITPSLHYYAITPLPLLLILLTLPFSLLYYWYIIDTFHIIIAIMPPHYAITLH